MGLLSKATGDSDKKDSKATIVASLEPQDGKLHAMIVVVPTGFKLGVIYSVETNQSARLDKILTSIQNEGREIVSVLPAAFDKDNQNFLIAYR